MKIVVLNARRELREGALPCIGKRKEKRLKRLARDIGQPDLDIIEEIKKLNATLGIPTVVKQLKVEDFDVITKRAHSEANPLYPVPVLFSPKELAKILEKVLPNE